MVLLEAYIALTLSTLYSDKGDKDKSLQLICRSRSTYYHAAPSYLTSQVNYGDAHSRLRHHKGNVTPHVRKRLLNYLTMLLMIHIVGLDGNDM